MGDISPPGGGFMPLGKTSRQTIRRPAPLAANPYMIPNGHDVVVSVDCFRPSCGNAYACLICQYRHLTTGYEPPAILLALPVSRSRPQHKTVASYLDYRSSVLYMDG